MAEAVVNAGVMAGGAAAGAAVVTAGFKAHHGIQRMAANAIDHEEKKTVLASEGPREEPFGRIHR